MWYHLAHNLIPKLRDQKRKIFAATLCRRESRKRLNFMTRLRKICGNTKSHNMISVCDREKERERERVICSPNIYFLTDNVVEMTKLRNDTFENTKKARAFFLVEITSFETQVYARSRSFPQILSGVNYV